jgi:hypothetical protein
MDSTFAKLHRGRLDGNQRLNLFKLSSQQDANLILVVDVNGARGNVSEGMYRPQGLNYQIK